MHTNLAIWQYLVTENMGKITAVLAVRTVFLEKIITHKDGHGTQDKRGKQVGVNVVTGTMEFSKIEQTQNSHFLTGKNTEILNLYSCENLFSVLVIIK